MRLALVVSVAINLLLASSLVAARVDVSKRRSARDEASVPAFNLSSSNASGRGAVGRSWMLAGNAEDAAAATSVGEVYSRLRSHGLEHPDTFLPVAGWVFGVLATASPGPRPYWRADPGWAAEDRRRRDDLEDRLRADLLALYGTGVLARAEFEALFFPLGRAFSFLSSSQQVAVVRWERERVKPQEEPANEPYAHTAGKSDCRVAPIVELSSRRRPDASEYGVPPSLDEQLSFEYALRTSPLAVRLRPLDLDEQTFREAYSLLAGLTRAKDLRGYVESRAQIERLLGADRFYRLWAGMDPVYTMLRDLLAGAGVSPAVGEAAYRIVAGYQDELLALLAGGGMDAATARRIAAARAEELQDLGRLLGPELADAVRATMDSPAGTGPAGCAQR